MNNKLIVKDCSLCSALHDKDEFKKPDRHYNFKLFQDKFFTILPSIGPLELGHVMVVSQYHKMNLASMGVQLLSKYDRLINGIRNKYSLYHTDLLEAEHGPVETNSAGSCIIHTHIHLIPNCGKFENIFDDKLDKILITKNIEDIAEITKPYIFVRGRSQTIIIYDANDVPSQYIRRIICKNEEREDWDWAVFPHNDIILETINYWRSQTSK